MKKGFTLAEVLITLAIIGVVAALTIPSVIINAREQGNITAFKKAVSVLNSAISLSIAVDSAGPATAATDPGNSSSLINQLMGKMNVIASSTAAYAVPADSTPYTAGGYITTADGMQFIPLGAAPTISGTSSGGALSYAAPRNVCYDSAATPATIFTETSESACTATHTGVAGIAFVTAGTSLAPANFGKAGNCSAVAPCFMVVDVNGTNTPNRLSSDVNSANGTITDRFVIAITDDGALPAGEQAKGIMAK